MHLTRIADAYYTTQIQLAKMRYNSLNHSGREAEGFQGSGFLHNEDSFLLEHKVEETEKVLNGLAHALRDIFWPSAFSLNT